MKLIVIIVSIILVFYSSCALSSKNIFKGVKSVSGSISYNNYKVDTSASSGPQWNFEISPKYLYFINNNLAIGAALGYSKSKVVDTIFEGYGYGPLFRYYMLNNSTLLPYISLNYFHSSSKSSGNNSLDTVYTTNTKSLGFGVDYFVAKNIAIETELTYSSTKRKVESAAGFSVPAMTDNDSYTNINIGVGINVFF